MPFFCIFFVTPTGMPSTKQGDTDLHLEADKRHQQQSTQALAEATPSQSEFEENQGCCDEDVDVAGHVDII